MRINRFRPVRVRDIGGAVSYGSSNVSYAPNDRGELDTKALSLSLYGSHYVGKN
jgi:hypothetical protein